MPISSWFGVLALVTFCNLANANPTQRGTILTGNDPLPKDYVLITSVPFPGHFSALLEIGKALQARGETIVVGFCFLYEDSIKEKELQERILNLGFTVYSFEPANAPHPSEVDLDTFAKKLALFDGVISMFQKISLHIVRSLLPVIKKYPPKLVLYEEMFAQGSHLAGLINRPGVIVSPHHGGFFCGFNAPFITPLVLPPIHIKDRFANALIRTILGYSISSRLGDSRAWCDSLGIPHLICFDWMAAVDHYGHLVLVTSTWPLVPAYHMSPVTHFVGPQISESGKRNKEIDDLLQSIRDRGNSILYVGMGSDMFLSESEFKNLFATLEQLTAKQNIEALWARGESMGRKYGVTASSKIHLKSFLPQKQILQSPNVIGFISHCGANGIMEASYYGVPVICIPLGREQPQNAEAFASGGASIHFDREKLAPEQILGHITAFLSSETVREKAQSQKTIVRSFGGVNRSVELIYNALATNGLKHMASFESELSTVERLSLDIIAILAIIVFVFIYIFQAIVRRCCCAGKKDKSKKD